MNNAWTISSPSRQRRLCHRLIFFACPDNASNTTACPPLTEASPLAGAPRENILIIIQSAGVSSNLPGKTVPARGPATRLNGLKCRQWLEWIINDSLARGQVISSRNFTLERRRNCSEPPNSVNVALSPRTHCSSFHWSATRSGNTLQIKFPISPVQWRDRGNLKISGLERSDRDR